MSLDPYVIAYISSSSSSNQCYAVLVHDPFPPESFLFSRFLLPSCSFFRRSYTFVPELQSQIRTDSESYTLQSLPLIVASFFSDQTDVTTWLGNRSSQAHSLRRIA